METRPDDSMAVRVGRLESSVANLHLELTDVKLAQRSQAEAQAAGFREIQASLSLRSQTNWPVIFGVITVVGALYAAAIAPLKQDVDRAQRAGETLATAVIVQNDKIVTLLSAISRLETQTQVNKSAVQHIEEFGSGQVDKRLAIMEYKLGIPQISNVRPAP